MAAVLRLQSWHEQAMGWQSNILLLASHSKNCVIAASMPHFVLLRFCMKKNKKNKTLRSNSPFTSTGAAQVSAVVPLRKGSQPQVSQGLLSRCLVCHYFHIQIQFAGSSSCHSALSELLSPLTCPCHCSRPAHLSPASFGCHQFHSSARPHRWSSGSWVCVLPGLPTCIPALALGHGRATGC